MSQDLENKALQIKNATSEGENTAERVGAWLLQCNSEKADTGGSTKTLAEVERSLNIAFNPVNESKIYISPDLVYIDYLRYSSPDGTFTDGQAAGIAIDSQDCAIIATITALSSANGITLSKVEGFLWDIEKNLLSNQYVLMYQTFGQWFSKYAAVHGMFVKQENRESFYIVNPNSFTIGLESLEIGSGLRLYRNGVFAELTSGAQLSGIVGSYSIVATRTGWNVGNSLSVRSVSGSMWDVKKTLGANEYLLCSREDGRWTSQYPQIQSALDRASRFNIFIRGVINIQETLIHIDLIRIGQYGTFAQTTPDIDLSISSEECSIIATITGYNKANSITLEVKEGFYWESSNKLNANQFLLCYRHLDAWQSDFAPIQSALVEGKKDKEITYTTKIVKHGGSIGVNCDYTDIKSALDNITDNSYYNRYIVQVLNGTYDVSNDGNPFLGLKNYVNIVGQSRNGVTVIKREAGNDASKSTFDLSYYQQEIVYSSIQNMTIIGKGIKGPIHIDDGYLKGTIELFDLNLINENNEEEANYLNCLACGLRKGQNVIVRNVWANGMLWAHNQQYHYQDEGCRFELYNCISKYIMVGDLISYGKDTCIVQGCKADYLTLYYYENWMGSNLGYVKPSFDFDFSGNKIGYIVATPYPNDPSIPSNYVWDHLYGGKHGICDPNIHNYCRAVEPLDRGNLVSLTSDKIMSVKKWQYGDRFYGMAHDNIEEGGYGAIHYNGVMFLNTDGSTPINTGDAVELNSFGICVKHSSGNVIGYAKQELLSGSGMIRIELIRK